AALTSTTPTKSTPGIAARMRAWCRPRCPTPTTPTRSRVISSRPPALPGPALLPLVLGLDEVQEAPYFGAEMTMRLEDLSGMGGRHAGAVDQPVRLVQCRDGLGRQAVPPQPDHVDAADSRGIAVDDHE